MRLQARNIARAHPPASRPSALPTPGCWVRLLGARRRAGGRASSTFTFSFTFFSHMRASDEYHWPVFPRSSLPSPICQSERRQACRSMRQSKKGYVLQKCYDMKCAAISSVKQGQLFSCAPFGFLFRLIHARTAISCSRSLSPDYQSLN